MSQIYERDLDLNLLRIFVVVAEAGSVTEAASSLYLTQPAVSAALKRLARAVGVDAPLFVRSGRGLALSARGERLLGAVKPHLEALAGASRAQEAFDAKTSDRVVRIGLSDVNETWLLPPLLQLLAEEAPRMRLVIVPVQFRTVEEALASAKVDLAVTVADDLPAGFRRQALFQGGFVCLFDPRHAKLSKKPTQAEYFAHEHVIVSYAGDLRGVVEDMLGLQRQVRVSIATFHGVGTVVDGTALLATVPALVAREVRRLRPHLEEAPLPFRMGEAPMELVWRRATDDDEALAFLRGAIQRIVAKVAKTPRNRRHSGT